MMRHKLTIVNYKDRIARYKLVILRKKEITVRCKHNCKEKERIPVTIIIIFILWQKPSINLTPY